MCSGFHNRVGGDKYRFCFLTKGFIPEAVDSVVVDHAYCLHEGVADCGADKFEASSFELFAHVIRLRGGARNFF